jgi:hypothetical protein
MISVRHIDNEEKKWDQALSAGLLMLKNFCGGEGELLLTVRTREAATPGVCCPLLLLFFRCRRERGSQHFSRRSSDRTKIKVNYLKIFMLHAAHRSPNIFPNPTLSFSLLSIVHDTRMKLVD